MDPISESTLKRIAELRDRITAPILAVEPDRWPHIYAGLLLLLGFAYQLAHPIVMGDTDMWYHLNGGRYFWETGKVPVTAFFSFMIPDREWINYFWGFQALVYKLYELGGYPALILLRALLFLGITWTIYRLLFASKLQGRGSLALLILLVGYFILMDGRSYQVRPHMVSYLCIALFLYILERRPRWALALPAIMVVWANLHGVEYVVAGLVCAAYLLEYLYRRFVSRRPDPAQDWRYPTGIVLCAPALLLNPHGLMLLAAPFVIPGRIDLYIGEMKSVTTGNFYSFAVNGLAISASSVFALLFLFSCYALIRTSLDRRLRLSHGILVLGALFLLSKYTRFIWEWALLSLPLLSQAAAQFPQVRPASSLPAFSPRNALVAAVLATPLATVSQSLAARTGWPLDPTGLPVGTTRFLEQIATGGNIFVPPTQAGYQQWRLYPKYNISSDMEFPPFRDLEMFQILSAMRDERSFRRFASTNPLDFLAVLRQRTDFQRLLKKSFPEYVPVFFDDEEVLYVDKQRHPEVAEQYALKAVNPHNLLKGSGSVEDQLIELKRVAALYPEGRRVNHALTWLLFDEKRYDDAMHYAQELVRHHPKDPNSHYWVGNILENTDACGEAIEHFEKAMAYADASFRKQLHVHIGTCQYLLQDFASAYEHLRQGLNPFQFTAAPEDLYQFAFSAVVMGKITEATTVLQMLVSDDDPKHADIRNKAEALLTDVEQKFANEFGPIDRLVNRLDHAPTATRTQDDSIP